MSKSLWADFKNAFTRFFESFRESEEKEDEVEEVIDDTLRGKLKIREGKDEEFSELKEELTAILSSKEDAEKLKDWVGEVIGVKERHFESILDDSMEEIKSEKKELEEKYWSCMREKSGSLDFAEALKKKCLCLPRWQVDILNNIDQDGTGHEDLLKRLSDETGVGKGIIRKGVDWLERAGAVKHSEDGSEVRLNEYGREISENSEKFVGHEYLTEELRMYLADRAVSGDKQEKEKLLKYLKRGKAREHRKLLEKLNEKYGNSFENVSKEYWGEEDRSGKDHLKHAGIGGIDNHEASGVLLYLELAELHLSEELDPLVLKESKAAEKRAALGRVPDDYIGFDKYCRAVEDEISEYEGRGKELIKSLPRLIRLSMKLLGKDIPDKHRSWIMASLGYILSPKDVVPEKEVGGEGYIDDLFLCSLVLNRMIESSGGEMVKDTDRGGDNAIELIKEVHRESRKIIEDKGIEKRKIFVYADLEDEF